MGKICIDWILKRNGIMPIMILYGISDNILAEKFLLNDIVNIFSEASKLGGVPTFKPDIFKKENIKIQIYCSLMFPSETEYQKFLMKFKKGEVLRRGLK